MKDATSYKRFGTRVSLTVNPLERGPRPMEKWCPECQMKGKPGGCPNCGRHA